MRNVVWSISPHWPHYVKTWRHPQNRKYITHCNVVRGGPSHGQTWHVDLQKIWWRLDMWFMRYASRQITYYCVHFNIVTNANDMRNEKSFSCQPINDRNSRRRHTTHPVPPLGELDEKYSSFMILAYSSHYYENLTLSTKPEVHNVLHCTTTDNMYREFCEMRSHF